MVGTIPLQTARFDALAIFQAQKTAIAELAERLEERRQVDALDARAFNADSDDLQALQSQARAIRNSVPINSPAFIQAQSIENRAQQEEIFQETTERPNVFELYQTVLDAETRQIGNTLSQTI